jgi:hypothetical protein
MTIIAGIIFPESTDYSFSYSPEEILDENLDGSTLLL